MKNYLLASARYGHGEGGAGKPGSNEVYGGHSHVGTMIYLGDNWPEEFRNHLFTHNLHGHQLNHQVNVREAGGYNTLHAGRDVLFCADQQYIGVDLQCGPDGAVYISDWYDPRHCHNPDVEQWNRGNGRMYRMKFDATYRPVKVDYTLATDEALAEAQLHPNDWHVRMSRLVLSQRAASRGVSDAAVRRLRELALEHPQAERRLRAVWALHAVGAIDAGLASRLLKDESEYIRGWVVQLAVESLDENDVSELLSSLAETETSLFVRRYLASAIPRVSRDLGWRLAEALGSQPENAGDRDLPLLLWHGVAELLPNDLPRAMKLGDETRLLALRDYVPWYATQLSPEGRNLIASRLASAEPDELLRLLSLFELSVRGMRGLPEPTGWSDISVRLYDSKDAAIRRAAESLGAAFGDEALYDRMRSVLAKDAANPAAGQHALSILASDASPENLPLFLKLIDSARLAPKVIPLLQRYDDPAVADVLIARLPAWEGEEGAATMEVLSSRPASAAKVLDAIAAGKLEKSRLTAYYVRQISSLGDEQLNARLAREWGAFGKTPSDVRAAIAKTVAEYESAPLWAYNAPGGAEHFKKLCASCHLPDQQKENLGPNLAGSGAKGIRYLVENILDPNAVIGRDYQARILVTADGRALSGLVESETDSAVTLRTATNRVVVAKDEIEEIRVSPNSFMPVGLLQTLNEREQIELFKYLMSQ
jgi:putative heme-binding domain-containing protein